MAALGDGKLLRTVGTGCAQREQDSMGPRQGQVWTWERSRGTRKNRSEHSGARGGTWGEDRVTPSGSTKAQIRSPDSYVSQSLGVSHPPTAPY